METMYYLQVTVKYESPAGKSIRVEDLLVRESSETFSATDTEVLEARADHIAHTCKVYGFYEEEGDNTQIWIPPHRIMSVAFKTWETPAENDGTSDE